MFGSVSFETSVHRFKILLTCLLSMGCTLRLGLGLYEKGPGDGGGEEGEEEQAGEGQGKHGDVLEGT